MSIRILLAAALVSVAFTISTRAQTPAPRWKNLQVLTDMQGKPEIELFDVMDFMAGSLQVSCDYCHAGAFENDAKPAKATARRMIQMMRSINDANFGGRPVINCQTCHQGHTRPASQPSPWYKTPHEIDAYKSSLNPAAASSSVPASSSSASAPLPTVDAVLTNYRKAVGATTAKTLRMIGKLTSENFGGPFEFLVVLPDQVRYTVQQPTGDAVQILNHDHGWSVSAIARDPIDPDFLNRIRFEWRLKLFLPPALMSSDASVSDIEPLNGRDCYVMTLRTNRGLERWYFDRQSSLLVKTRRETPTPFGTTIRESEFLDYRASGGGFRPFTIRDHYMGNQFDFVFTDIQTDVPVDPAIFEPPAPKERVAIALPPAALDAVAGKYQTPSGIGTVTHEGTQLFFTQPNGTKLELLASAALEFFIKGTPVVITFVRNASGEVTLMRVVQGNVVREYQRIR